MMTPFLLFAAEADAAAGRLKQVTPLSPAVKVAGTVLGVLVVVVGLWLWLSHRAQAGKPEEEQGLGARLRWRTPIALLLAMSGGLVIIGVWIDPTTAPGAFIVVWLLAMAVLAVTILAAGLDWWWVTRLATTKRQALVQQGREQLFDELRRRRPPPPQSNGSH